jgi:ELWxxDGT repeat protein
MNLQRITRRQSPPTSQDPRASRRPCSAEPLERRVLLADTGVLLQAASAGVPTYPTNALRVTGVNGTVFFSGAQPDVGRELMATDGTVAGTRVVKDINPGLNGSKPTGLTDVNGTLYFFADDGVHGYELWKSDGTAAGTVMVRDINPGPAGSFQPFSNDLYGPGVQGAALGNTFFFTTGFDDALWKSDGTEAGTVRVKSLGLGYPTDFPVAAAGGFVYFTAGGGASGAELWRTDGTPGGTSLVKDIVPGPDPSYPATFIPVGNLVFFTATPSATGDVNARGLFRTDGTPQGTIQLADGVSAFMQNAVVGRTLYFVPGYKLPSETHPGDDSDLWKTDGTVAGTVKVKDFPVAPDLSPTRIVGSYSGGVLLTAYAPETGTELWKSDGTPGGTVLVKDFVPGPEGSNAPISEAREVNGTIWLSGYDRAHGYELWRSDGTSAGTTLVKDVLAGTDSNSPHDFLPSASGKVVFVGYSVPPGRLGYEEWDVYATDGTEQGTTILRPDGPVVVGRHVFYNNSSFDGNNAAANAADDRAVAPDKRALLPGQAASSANVTTFVKGINGVMIDVRSLPAGDDLSGDDFTIRSGSSLSPADLQAGPSDVRVSVRRGAGEGGSDRVTLTWPDYNPAGASPLAQAVANGWLEVTVKADEDTGLARPDVFYFGNLIGDVVGDFVVNALDIAAVKFALNKPATIDSERDVNRDGRVNALDVAAVKQNLNRRLSLPPAPTAVAAAALVRAGDAAGGATDLLREA